MGRLSNIRIVDQVLTKFAWAYTNSMFVGTKLLPIVFIDKEAGKVPKFGKEAFKLIDTKRAIRANSNRRNPEGIETIDVNLDEHDEEYPIDYREISESAFNIELRATNTVSGSNELGLEKQIADIVQDTNNYATDNKVTLTSTDKWSDYNNSDPVDDVEYGKNVIRKAIGAKPNVGIMGADTFQVLQGHPKMVEKIKYSMKGIVTIDIMKEVLQLDQLYVGEAVYSTDDGVNTDVWGDNFVMGYVPNANSNLERDYYEPSFGYTFRKRSYPQIDKYDESGGKIKIVRNTDTRIPMILGNEAGYIIKDTK